MSKNNKSKLDPLPFLVNGTVIAIATVILQCRMTAHYGFNKYPETNQEAIMDGICFMAILFSVMLVTIGQSIKRGNNNG